MIHYKLILGLVVAFAALVVVIPVNGQGGTQEPAYKQAFEATAAAKRAQYQNLPRAPKAAVTPVDSCPDLSPVLVGVFDYQDQPLSEPIDPVNYAIAIGSDGATYEIDAGSPLGNSTAGEMVVLRAEPDTCAARLAGRDGSTQVNIYGYFAGQLTLTAVDGDIVDFTGPQSVIGHFNYITGQFFN